MCEFNVIGNKVAFDFSKYRKKRRASKVVSFLSKITGILILGSLITTYSLMHAVPAERFKIWFGRLYVVGIICPLVEYGLMVAAK